MKKLIVSLTATALLSTGGVYAFTDTADSEYKTEIEFFEEANIFSGKEDGKFYPDDTLTRAEAAKILYDIRFADESSNIESQLFSDVESDFWAYNEINKLAYEGIISGFGDGTFHPDETLTGIQLLTLCTAITGYRTFADETLGWKEQSAKIGTEYGFLSGLSNLDCNVAVTRAEAAKMLYNTVNIPIAITQGLIYDEISESLVPDIVIQDGTNETELQTLWIK